MREHANHGSAQQLEQRRPDAVAPLDNAMPLNDVVRCLGVSRRSVDAYDVFALRCRFLAVNVVSLPQNWLTNATAVEAS